MNFTLKDLKAHSVAMYSTWVYHKPTRILFDAGEGLSTEMRNFVFGIDKVFLSHGHYDHIGGVAGLVFSRAAARGDKEKPLAIHYPKGCRQVEALRRFVEQAVNNIKYDLSWVPVEPGFKMQISKNLRVEAFAVKHSKDLCLGYKMVETRSKLRPELVGKTQSEIAEFARSHGKSEVSVSYEKVVFAYCGDSTPVPSSDVANAEVLLHEATFVDEGDREANCHSSVREAVAAAMSAGAESLVLMHMSSRYNVQEIKHAALIAARHEGFEGPLAVLVGHNLWSIQ